ncbi:hypothetical protein SDC9_123443 [bioreactor metagenome]|uniref:Inner membrane protein YgaP-like transmembrane domain-containing protein n=1 Tax=bioreactor metagenome TaxID=1076179 RepID=A0A645CHP0_9ZZZZ
MFGQSTGRDVFYQNNERILRIVRLFKHAENCMGYEAKRTKGSEIDLIRKLPPTARRVAERTCDETNADIREKTVNTLNIYKDSTADVISERIESLNEEWDVERVLEAHAASIILIGSVLGMKKRRRWPYLTGAAGLFLLMHALEGWCPPLPVIRQMGIRTAEEIFNEKTVLKMLRGDFVQETDKTEEMLAMAEKE